MKTLRSKTMHYLAIGLGLITIPAQAQKNPALVDFDAYQNLVQEVKEHRKNRMLTAKEFMKVSHEEKVIILDTRSKAMYTAVHVKGALHLNFSDFTQDNLKKIIPSPDYKILIYCNNNFISQATELKPVVPSRDYSIYFATKSFVPERTFVQPASADLKRTQLVYPPTDKKPLTLALNIPTYINLYGYGYRNVYELSELVNTYDDIIPFEGTAVNSK